MKRLLICCALLLAGCASTGVIPVGNGVYMISKQSAAGIFGTPAGIEADIYREANAYCAARHQVIETVDVQTVNAVSFYHEGAATLHFRCVQPPPAPAKSG